MFANITDTLAKRRARRMEIELGRRQAVQERELEWREQKVQRVASDVYIHYIKACQSRAKFKRKVRQRGMRIRLKNYFNAYRGAMETRVIVRDRKLRTTCVLTYSEHAKLVFPPMYHHS